MKLRHLVVGLFMAIVITPSLHAGLQVSVSGNSIVYSASGQGPDSTYCTIHLYVDGQSYASVGNAPPCGTVSTLSGSKGCNWVGKHEVAAYVTSPSGPPRLLGQQMVTVVDRPSATSSCTLASEIRFDITNYTLPDDRRVLLSNLSTNSAGVPNYPYPRYQALLGRDRAIPVSLRVIVDTVATSGMPVEVQVTDPPDPSTYMTTVPPGYTTPPGSQTGDNSVQPPLLNPTLPRLVGMGVTPLGNDTYSVISGPDGYITLEMELDESSKAGDNYQVTATATLPDSTTLNGTSGVITAWKRMFVEKRQMFRRGAPLAANAPAGVTRILVTREPIASSGDNDFSRGDSVMLLHAPPFGQPKVAGSFYQEVHQIALRPTRYSYSGSPVLGVGTVTTDGTTTIVGKGTRFSNLGSGDVITIGLDTRVVIAVADNTQLTVDVPTTTGSANQAYRIGDPGLEAGNYYWLTLDGPVRQSFQREPSIDSRDRGKLTLNDAVVRLAGTSVAKTDYFDAEDSLLVGTNPANVFPAAFTEYIVLPPTAGVVNQVPRMLLPPDKWTQRFIDKWFETPVAASVPSTDPDPMDKVRYHPPANHQLVLVGDTDDPNVALSGRNGFLSDKVSGERASLVNRATVEDRTGRFDSPLYEPVSSARPATVDTVLRRTLVHEVTHQWLVNKSKFGEVYLDHCHPQVAYNSTHPYPAGSGTPPQGLQFCLMSYADSGLMMPAPWDPATDIPMVQYHYRFGLASFHMTRLGGGWNSEYTSLRNVPDPWTP